MSENKLQPLPIGTVVKIEGSAEPMMIVCQLPVTEVDSHKGYFDFGAVKLPIGLSSQELFFLNREDISELIFIGYADIRFQNFVKDYDDMLAAIKYEKLHNSGISTKVN